MKNLIIIVALLLATQLNAQTKSLADKTGENTSLYDAVCIINDIVPGSIGMKEGRKLMNKYSETIGLNYKLYLHNGGNNLYILHYKSDYINEEVLSEIDDTDVNSDKPDQVLPTCNACTVHNLQVNRPSTDTIVITKIDTVIMTTLKISNTIIVDTVTLIEEVEYCNCTGLSLDEAWAQHELLKKEWKNDRLENNQYINSECRVKLRKYIRALQKEEYDITRNERRNGVEVIDNRWETPMVDNITVKNDIKPAAKKIRKKRRARKLGKGHAKGRGGIWSKLFPFANC